MPADPGNAPLQVLVEIRDILAEILGQQQHQAVEKDRQEAEAELRRAAEESRQADEDDITTGAGEERARISLPSWRPPETAGADKEQKQDRSLDRATSLLTHAGGAFAEVAQTLGQMSHLGGDVRDLLSPPAPAAERLKQEDEPTVLDRLMSLFSHAGGTFGEIAGLVRQMEAIGKDFLGFFVDEKEARKKPDLPEIDLGKSPLAVPIVPGRPEPAREGAPGEEEEPPAVLPYEEPAPTLTPTVTPTPAQREPLEELPGRLEPEQLPLPELPALEALLPPVVEPLPPRERHPEESPVQPTPQERPLAEHETPTPLVPAPESPRPLPTRPEPHERPLSIREHREESPRRLEGVHPVTLPPVVLPSRESPIAPALIPQPGQGTSPGGVTSDDDEGNPLSQTVPILTPGPVPATASPTAQQQQDNQRLAIALERLLLLLQRQAGEGGHTGDTDEDETEQGENYQTRGLGRSMWRQGQATPTGHGEQPGLGQPRPQHPSSEQHDDELRPGRGAGGFFRDAAAIGDLLRRRGLG